MNPSSPLYISAKAAISFRAEDNKSSLVCSESLSVLSVLIRSGELGRKDLAFFLLSRRLLVDMLSKSGHGKAPGRDSSLLNLLGARSRIAFRIQLTTSGTKRFDTFS